MAEETNPQQKNRVIYNVNDLFFGLVSGEKNIPYITGDNGQEVEVVKRIHRVQSVTYDFQVNRQDIGVLGRASFDESIVTDPPDINVTVTHTLEGLNNETRMGFNVLTNTANTSYNKEFSDNFISGNKQQNIYLAVNQDDIDIREPSRDPIEIYNLIGSGRYRELTHPETDKMGMIVFQNCHASSYNLDITVNSLPKADTAYVADNAIYLNSCSGQHVPWLNTKTAEVTYKKDKDGNNVEFIIPRNYKRVNPNFNANYSFRPSDAVLTIETRPSPADSIFTYDFEDGGDLVDYVGTQKNNDTQAYGGTKSLKITSLGPGNGDRGGAKIDLTPYKAILEANLNKYYTFTMRVKTSSMTNVMITAEAKDSNGVRNELNTFKEFKYGDGWVKVYKRFKLTSFKDTLYIATQNPNVDIWIDEIYMQKESENPPLKFHTNLMQSLKLNIPLTRENISVVGYKYHADRAVQLPIKSTFSIDMISQDLEFPVQVEGEDRQGNFIDNLRKDEEYDISLTFNDNTLAEAMKFRIYGGKFQGVSYGLDIDSPKTTSLNFALSNDYDYGRNVISAEGRGIFVLDVLVNDSMIPLTDDNGNLLGDAYPFNF